jgi:type II secretory pathway component PulF
MPLIVTPRQLTLRSQFYRQLGQLTAAGIPIIGALEMLSRNPPARSFREPIKQMITQLSLGSTVSEALAHLGLWVPSFDIALVRAAEHSGRLDTVFKLLADFYDDRARLLRQIIRDLAYPAFLFHFSIFLFPFIQWFGGTLSPAKFIVETFGILLPIYGGILLVIYASQGRRGAKWRAIFELLLRPIPVLGTARHYLALARLAAALEALINAGVTIIEAWEMAAAACGSPAIQRAVTAWKPDVVSGELPSEAVNKAPRQFPELFANLYKSGEVSGQLDDSLKRIHIYYQEEGTNKLHLLAAWVPKIIYFGVAIMVAVKVISFYTGYFQTINQISNGFGSGSGP